jgi:hypothetical protein
VSTGVQVSVDALDPARLARFWAVALDYVEQPPPDGFASWDAFADSVGIPVEDRDAFAAVVDPAGHGPRLLFQKVPEAKTAKNRMHLDVNASGPDHDWAGVEARVAALVEAGGTVVAERSRHGDRWVVMQDPEGNELCVQ